MSEDSRENPLKAEKRKKLTGLREKGINPFPYKFDVNKYASDLKIEFGDLQEGEKKEDKKFKLAGRVMTKRPMGKAAFFNVMDQSGTIQVYLKKESLSESDRTAFEHLDIGDIVGIEGFVFKTKKGELSINAQGFAMLCKTIEPLPEKFHGLTDVELKYRYRHLDLIMNPKTKEVFKTRTKIIKEIRNYLDEEGFLEVETPILQPIYGGAAAYPFKTHHRALDMTLFMKISPELYLKRLIVGGFDKVYDLNKNFRNEGIDRSHNPEFTMLEWYEAYTDYNDQMKRFEDLVCRVVKAVKGTTKITYQGRELDFTPPWRRLTVYDGLKEYGNLDVESMSDADLFSTLSEKFGVPKKKQLSRGELIMELFENLCEKHLWEPTFIMDFPVDVSPLTKVHRSNPDLVERFEPMVAHMELGNAYSELNDPEDQKARLIEQEKKRVIDDEAQPMDEDFLHAIDVGMPPTGGVGLGVERLVMMITDCHSIRDILFFPTMKFKD